MKRQYLNPSIEVIEIRQQCNILTGSVTDVTGNTGIGYGGGGHVEPTAPGFDDEFDALFGL